MGKLFTVSQNGLIYIGFKKIGYILHTQILDQVMDIQHFDTKQEMIDYIFNTNKIKKESE